MAAKDNLGAQFKWTREGQRRNPPEMKYATGTMRLDDLGDTMLGGVRFARDYSMSELAEDIKARGILTPIMARHELLKPDRGTTVVDGHHRKDAARLAGFEEAPVNVRYWADNPPPGLMNAREISEARYYGREAG